jgi:hypothetical protein
MCRNTRQRLYIINNLRGAERFTNRLLYQLSYVGFALVYQTNRSRSRYSPESTCSIRRKVRLILGRVMLGSFGTS